MSSLLEPIAVGKDLPLRSRVVMGSMTRNRCMDNHKPGPAQVKYYADRAKDGTGLIVTEGTFIDWTGSDFAHAPFLITQEHADAWCKVTDAVHQVGGKIFCQLWHAGRCQHDQIPLMKEHGGRVLAPSAIRAEAGKYRDIPGHPGHTDNVEAIEDVKEAVDTYRRAITLAKKANFDGIELLAQGGFLIQQFLNSRANKRTDNYGGSVENRCRFLLEVVDAIAEIFGGPEKTCVKINPTDYLNDSIVGFEELQEVYGYLITALVKRKVGIINLGRRGLDPNAGSGDLFGRFPRPEGYPLPPDWNPLLDFGRLMKFPGSSTLLMANHDYTVEEADELIRSGQLDLITFARPFIYNPDIVTRIKHGIPFRSNDRGPLVHYGPGKTVNEYYNDWPIANV